jgi:enoyl-[acyl-carrier protein] reductase I
MTTENPRAAPVTGLVGKNVVVMGVAGRDSIAWAIAEAFLEDGAHVTITYQQRFLSRVRQVLKDFPAVTAARCDVMQEAELEAFFAGSREPIDVLVHSIAFGPPEIFTRPPSEVSREAFLETQGISVHSLAAVVRHAAPRMREWGSVITLSYQASQRVKQTYGMMGVAKAALECLVRYLAVELGKTRRVRVNAISPGPIPTIAALSEIIAVRRNRGLAPGANPRLAAALEEAERAEPRLAALDDYEFARQVWAQLQRHFVESSAIHDLVEARDVADCALFLGSDRSRKMTGQVLLVDCGHSIVEA